MPRHFLSTLDRTPAEIHDLLSAARILRDEPRQSHLDGRAVALVFFNPSLRTRTSFEVGVWEMGGHAVVLEPGKGAWSMAFGDGEVMDGDAEEHVREAARVLSEYVDVIGVRCFPAFRDWPREREDPMIRAFAERATVPIVNMETIEHPCQELAHAMALSDRLGDLAGRKYVLTWTWHPRPLNTAVANSSLLIASAMGMDITLLCPDERYVLDDRYMDAARSRAAETGGALRVSHDIDEAYDGAEVVYAKSWGALPFYGRWDDEAPIRAGLRHFIVDEAKMSRTNDAVFSHCLPVRRNVKVTDAVIDGPNSLVIEEAANRRHVQKAILADLVGSPVRAGS